MKTFFITVLITLSCNLASADVVWQGNTDSKFQTSGNWDSAPTAKGSNDGSFTVANGSSKPLIYLDSDGATTFNGQFMIGQGGSTPGEMKITGGTLTINDGNYGPIIGQTATGLLTITGGELDLTGGHPCFVGNEADGTIKLVGGTINLDNDLIIGRNTTINGGNFNGIVVITDGKFTVQGQTSFDVDGGGGSGGTGVKKLEFGLGSGLFVQATSGTLSFPVADDAAYVNFVSGSKGAMSLNGAKKDYFEGLVKAGRIKIDNKTADVSKFSFSNSGTQGVYQLAF